MWAIPLPKSLTTVRLATDFNQVVQWDILFHRKLMISHLLDEAIRWTAGSMLKRQGGGRPDRGHHDPLDSALRSDGRLGRRR